MECLPKNIKEEVTCSICLDFYSKPKTIACFHTFCCKCLEKHALMNQTEGQFRCPECQAQVDVPEENRFENPATSFLHNGLLSLLTVQQSDGSEKSIACGNCRKKDSEIHFCFDCGRFMCVDCLNAHELLKVDFQEHKVIAIKEFQASDYEALLKRQPFCSQQYHEREVMKFYCLPCQMCVCNVCVVTDHRSHDVVALEKAAQEEKANIMAGAESIRSKEKMLSDLILQLETTTFEVETNIASAKKKVSESANGIITQVREIEREFITSLEKTRESRLEKLNSATKQVQSLMKQINQAAEFANNLVQRSSSSDFMQNKNNLEQRFQELLNIKVPALPVHAFIKFTSTFSPESFRFGLISEKPDLSRSTLEGLNQDLQAGLEAEFVTCIQTADGEISHRLFNNQVAVLVKPVEQVASLSVCEKEDGNYHVKFTPKIPGSYIIEIEINGDKLSNSPCNVQVKDRQLVVDCELELNQIPQLPFGIAVNSQGTIAVTDCYDHCVHIFDKEGKHLRKVGKHGVSVGQFNYPIDVEFLNDNEILVADHLNHRVQQFNVQTGTFVRTFGKKGTAEGEFKNPASVCMDEKGHVVVADLNNNRIQVLTKEGHPMLTFGDRGPESLNQPLKCVPRENKFIVSDGSSDCIKVFDRSGEFLYKFGGQGQADGQFNRPFGLCVDSFGNLLVCDQRNGRIQQFTLEARFTGKSSIRLPNPVGIATAPDGRILVTDPDSDKKVYYVR